MKNVSAFNTSAPSSKKAFSACIRLGRIMGTLDGVSIFLFDRDVLRMYPFGAVRLCG